MRALIDSSKEHFQKRKNVYFASFLVTVGSLQMIGDLTNIKLIKGLGAATHSSPAPKVFTAHEGFETFSSQFFIHWNDKQGNKNTLELTPSTYKTIRGPYNRRNVYGAAVSYGPILSRNPNTQVMFEQVSDHAFCGEAPILQELGIEISNITYPIHIELRPREENSKAQEWNLNYYINCDTKEKNNA